MEGEKDIPMADSHQTKKGNTSEQQRHQPYMQSEEDKRERAESPTDSQKTISDDDEIDYSIKPEFYDPDLDDKDEIWVQKQRKCRSSDAVLSCPACFTTLCLECQRHEKYLTRYRAVFVTNCKIKSEASGVRNLKRKRGMKGRGSSHNEAAPGDGETFKPVCCAVCSTEVGVIDEEEVYHFFDVLPSEC
ncbi:uncharacterized protein LOC127810488 isoform X2 [Diospyros lotus]|uniref:uncharacterized protein LOC127810488 isoform X2 n=1 Tax=Diospyros lotus TaxID=55363 RepID=UPI002250C9E9|nr:uncharacterized protein LOC127810488 isoform X2 [Diospyros lotus]